MARTTNTVPYTNARRAGRTHPGVIEFITELDPRFRPSGRPILGGGHGKAFRPRRGTPIRKSAPARRLYRPELCLEHTFKLGGQPHTFRDGRQALVVRCTRCGHCAWATPPQAVEGAVR